VHLLQRRHVLKEISHHLAKALLTRF